jgi:hypothetical protein
MPACTLEPDSAAPCPVEKIEVRKNFLFSRRIGHKEIIAINSINSINSMVQTQLGTEEKVYLSCDTPIGSKTFDPYYMAEHQVEVLNEKKPSGFPPYKLQVLF